MGLSQQKFADLLGEKRGKVAGYFYETQSKPNFHHKLAEQFHLDLGKFLTLEMNEVNYESFFTTKNDQITTVQEPDEDYGKRMNAIDLLLKAKRTEDKTTRDKLIDEALSAYMKALDRNDTLREEILKLQKDLLALTKKS